MPRLRLLDFRASTGPQTLGICNTDFKSMAAYVNSAQRRLLLAREAGDEGWWGTWAEVAFTNVSQNNPYITCPRNVARLEKLSICNRPIPIHNQFYEYLDFGNGRLPKQCQTDCWFDCQTLALTRNNVITMTDQSVSPCLIRVYASNSVDIGAARRVLIQGLDASGSTIYSQDGNVQVEGVFLTLDTPFEQSVEQFSRITGIQKDVTNGNVQIFQVDPATGEETILLTMDPGETVAGYRRYYLNSLPRNCCSGTGTDVCELTVTAIVKLELIPAVIDTDYLLLQNLEAIIEECIAIRMSRMDELESQKLAAIHHLNAIRYLNSEIAHYLGKQSPAVSFAPFGSAKLECQKIGSMI